MSRFRLHTTDGGRFSEAAVAAVGIVIGALIVALAAILSLTQTNPTASDPVAVRVSTRPISRPVPPGFVGLSLETSAPVGYAGTDPRALNPQFIALVRGLAPGQSPVIRIGGDSTEGTWWPAAGVAQGGGGGLNYRITPTWLAVVHALAARMNARLILGVNLEADNARLAGAEARAFERGIGRRYIAGFELGNEPEVYGHFGWYKDAAGVWIRGRRPSYDFNSYLGDFARISAALPTDLPLVGPASGGPRWLTGLPRFLARERRIAIATYHRYPLHRCFLTRASPAYPTIPHLLTPHASSWPATSLRQAVAVAHAHGIPLRSDELNSVSCSGKAGVSNVFAAALWSVDTLFHMAQVGVDGVNIHTFPGARYAPFSFTRVGGRWRATVWPLYYGLTLFARTAPPGSRLLATTAGGPSTLRTWATQARDGTVRVVLINDAQGATVSATVSPPAGAGRIATVQHLVAPGAAAQTGIRLTAGRSVGADPRGYVVRLRPASVAVLTLRG